MLKKLSLTLIATLMGASIANAADLTLNIEETRNDKGYILIGLFDNAEAFNAQKEKEALISVRVKAKKGGNKITLHGLENKKYAVTVMHDENNNEKFDVDGDQFPEEGFGYSKNVMVEDQKSAFQQTSFDLNDANSTQNIKLVYIK